MAFPVTIIGNEIDKNETTIEEDLDKVDPDFEKDKEEFIPSFGIKKEKFLGATPNNPSANEIVRDTHSLPKNDLKDPTVIDSQKSASIQTRPQIPKAESKTSFG